MRVTCLLGDNEEINTLCQCDLSQLDAVQAQQLLVSRVGRFRMRTVLPALRVEC